MALGPNLLAGGDFESSTGTGFSSVLVGPQSDYAPCGPNIFAAPCGAATYSLFTGNMASVTGNHPGASAIVAQGRSLAINGSTSLTARMVYWSNIWLTNGLTYRAGFDMASTASPSPVAVRVDGNIVLTFPAPDSVRNWRKQRGEFVWTGPSGLHTVAFTNNDTAAGGNDHALDNFYLRTVSPSRDCGCQRPQSCAELGEPDWFRPFPPVHEDWQYSSNSGGLWAQALTNYNHGAVAVEQLRWRHLFTIPNGFAGQWRISIAGDKYDVSGQTGAARFYMDGVLLDSNTEANNAVHWSPWVNVTPGPHIFEWREPGYSTAGATIPQFGVDYSLVTCLPGF